MMRSLRPLGLLAAAAALAGCNPDRLVISNPNSPTVAAAGADPLALQLQATGLLRQLRNGRGSFVTSTGRFGREAYIYTPQEGRNTSAYLIGISGQNRLDPAGFAVENWGTQYGNLRDIFNFKNTVNSSTVLTAEQKNAALGFARTLEGLELLYVISTRDTLGAVVEIKQDASDLAPFVSRDSVYKYILGTLDAASTNLAAGGAAFPFTLHGGFTGFNTPATFRQFNRAIAARAAAYYATAGGGTTAWQQAISALGASFLNTGAASRADLDRGPAHVYSTASGDANNPLNAATNTDLYAHMSYQTDVQNKANGQPDDRFTAKIGARPARNAPQGLGVVSSLGFNLYPTTATSLPIVRNEELLLLRAEALLATGDRAGAVAIIDQIRAASGGLPASGLTSASSTDAILTELLYNKRYSLALEGHRWIDMRRYGRLNQLPLDITSGTNAHFVARVQPIPQSECLVRVGKTGALAGPGC
ncbi:MAG: RagB/SusD family nutrient uptake outer membrane protein [Gemmatimonadetes bacterium]|nr:RagB/SusD family nutrient uptake outer membrane protein [Gemmatimonadota bacterium]